MKTITLEPADFYVVTYWDKESQWDPICPHCGSTKTYEYEGDFIILHECAVCGASWHEMEGYNE